MKEKNITFAVTIGSWGGIYFYRGVTFKYRLCLGFIAFTYFRGDFADLFNFQITKNDNN